MGSLRCVAFSMRLTLASILIILTAVTVGNAKAKPLTITANIGVNLNSKSRSNEEKPPPYIPPEYLKVPHWKDCLGSKDMGLWTAVCMPATIQSDKCPYSSWLKLKEIFDGPDYLDCDLESNEEKPPPYIPPEYLKVPHWKDCLGSKDM